MSDTALFTRDDLRQQREKVRRSFLRANTSVAVVLVAVLGLAVAAVLSALSSVRSQQRAEVAERDAREVLWNSYLAQAQAARMSGSRGHKTRSLDAVRSASSVRSSVALRNEAIAALACADLEEDRPIHPVAVPYEQAFQFGLRLYAIAGRDAAIALYRAEDHSEVARLTWQDPAIPRAGLLAGFEFTRDCRNLVVLFKNSTIVVWDLATLKPALIRPAPKGFRVENLSVSANGTLCVTERQGTKVNVALIDLTTGSVRSLPIFEDARSASLRPGWNQLAISVGNEVLLWDMETMKTVATYANPGTTGPCVWSSDGTWFAVTSSGSSIHLWNVASGQFQSLPGHTESIRSLVFSPDDRVLLTTAWDHTTRLWDVQSGSAILACEGEIGLEFSEDGGRIGYVRPGAGVGIWRFERSAVFRVVQSSTGADSTMPHFDLSPSGRWLGAVVDGDVQLWDLSRPGPAGVERIGDVTTLTVHPNESELLLCRPAGLEIRSIRAGSPVEAPRLGPPRVIAQPEGTAPRQATMSLDGRSTLVEWQNLRFSVIDTTGELPTIDLMAKQWFRNNLTPASATGSGRMAISPDARWVAVGYSVGQKAADGDVEAQQRAGVWDTRTGHLVFTPERRGAVAFSADNRWLIVRSEAACHLYEVDKWTNTREMPLQNLASQTGSTAMTADGRLLAASRSRQSVQLLDPDTGLELATLISPVMHSVKGLRCALDGSRVAIATADRHILLWNLTELRRELSALGLDWDGGETPELGGFPVPTGVSFPDTQARMILVGLTSAGVTVFFGLLILSWHRQLIQRFVRTEATVEKRSGQLELAKLELLQAEKMKALGTLAAGIAHDFNNLLSVIRMSNQLASRAQSREETAEYVAAIEQAVLQGKTVVGSMLGYSRESKDDEGPCDVSALVEQTALLLSKEFLSGITLRLELDRASKKLFIDKGKLQQALLNLVVNAAEAMNGIGTLVLSVESTAELPDSPDVRFAVRPRPAAGYVRIQVADTGPGISPEILDRIFEPFFTTKTAGTERGTGLGLSLVHAVAGQEGCGLAVRSTPGLGSTFYLFLPDNEFAGSAGF